MSTATTSHPLAAAPLVRRPLPALGLCLAVLVAASDVALAQDQAFKSGMEAYDNDEWERVVEFMREAIQADAQESPRRVEYGGLFGFRVKSTEYLPLYYLGEALVRQQQSDCSGAIDAWARSEKAGVIQKRPDLQQNVQEGYIVCRTRGVLPASEFDPLIKQAQQQYEDVNAIADRVTTFGRDNPDLFRQDVREGYDQARGDLEVARQRLTSGSRTRAVNELEEARRATERARLTLTVLDSSLGSAFAASRAAQAAAREAEQALGTASTLRGQLENRLGGRTSALTPAMSTARQRAEETLERGRAQYTAGTKAGSQPLLADARNLGQEAAKGFRQLLEELDALLKAAAARQLADARTSAGQALKFVEDLFTTLDRRMAANPTLATSVTDERSAATQQATAIRQRLDRALRGENVRSIAAATRDALQLRDVLNELTARFGPLTLRERGVNEALEQGAASFFAGRYQETLDQLNPAGGFAPDDPLQLHVHLFRAASLFALYAHSRETNTQLRDQALAEIDECKRIDSAFQPDPRAFSPRFLAFYREETGEAPSSAQR